MNNSVNLYELGSRFAQRQFHTDKFLFVEFNCLPGNQRTPLISEYNYFVYVVQGKKTWITSDGKFSVNKGEALFLKKGVSYVIESDPDHACVLLFFLPDTFIHEIILEFRSLHQPVRQPGSAAQQLIPVQVDIVLGSFFESVLSYFHVQNSPPSSLLRLKFKELILHILTGNQNKGLRDCLLSAGFTDQANVQHVMDQNFLHNLPLEDYARLCNRSLTSFKRDFQRIYKSSPGKWLNQQRLQHARILLLSTHESISDIAFHSGFETTSHFIRCFKKEFGLPPLHFRLQAHTEPKIPVESIGLK